MKRLGTADLKLMGGSIPTWLFERMTKLSLPIVEAIIQDYGIKGFFSRLSDPFWFQSFGAVIGMDWNSSGVTTAVMSALKKSLNPHSDIIGIYVCGGKGNDSVNTPKELLQIGNRTGLDGESLVKFSKLTAKVDSAAIQDGFQVYMHYFIVSCEADWSVVQQGMQPETAKARRYHWNSEKVHSFVEDPHTAIWGEHQGEILNLVDKRAQPTQRAILDISQENPDLMLHQIKQLVMPTSYSISCKDVDLKRLGGILRMAQEAQTQHFEELLLLKGLGPRTLQSLALVSEVIHGTPSRFSDPARFSLAHGGKGGRPFPIPTKVYDETIESLRTSVEKSKIGEVEKSKAIKKLNELAQKAEKTDFFEEDFDRMIQKEREDAWMYGGRTLNGFSTQNRKRPSSEET